MFLIGCRANAPDKYNHLRKKTYGVAPACFFIRTGAGSAAASAASDRLIRTITNNEAQKTTPLWLQNYIVMFTKKLWEF